MRIGTMPMMGQAGGAHGHCRSVSIGLRRPAKLARVEERQPPAPRSTLVLPESSTLVRQRKGRRAVDRRTIVRPANIFPDASGSVKLSHSSRFPSRAQRRLQAPALSRWPDSATASELPPLSVRSHLPLAASDEGSYGSRRPLNSTTRQLTLAGCRCKSHRPHPAQQPAHNTLSQLSQSGDSVAAMKALFGENWNLSRNYRSVMPYDFHGSLP